MTAKRDLTGQVFGNLTVMSVHRVHWLNVGASWKCLCSCGTTRVVNASRLLNGHTKSCGCLSKNRWTGEGDISGHFWSDITRNAHSRNLEVTVTLEGIWNLFLKQNRNCAISGVPLYFEHEMGNRMRDDKTASLDRIDSSKGYVEGNVQWIHKNLNAMKSDLSDQELIAWCKTIADYQRQKEKESGVQEPSKTP